MGNWFAGEEPVEIFQRPDDIDTENPPINNTTTKPFAVSCHRVLSPLRNPLIYPDSEAVMFIGTETAANLKAHYPTMVTLDMNLKNPSSLTPSLLLNPLTLEMYPFLHSILRRMHTDLTEDQKWRLASALGNMRLDYRDPNILMLDDREHHLTDLTWLPHSLVAKANLSSSLLSPFVKHTELQSYFFDPRPSPSMNTVTQKEKTLHTLTVKDHKERDMLKTATMTSIMDSMLCLTGDEWDQVVKWVTNADQLREILADSAAMETLNRLLKEKEEAFPATEPSPQPSPLKQ